MLKSYNAGGTAGNLLIRTDAPTSAWAGKIILQTKDHSNAYSDRLTIWNYADVADLDWNNVNTKYNDMNVSGINYLQTSNLNVSGTASIENLTISGTGIFQLTMNSTSITCNDSTEGAIYYNGGTNKHYGCNGTGWNALY